MYPYHLAGCFYCLALLSTLWALNTLNSVLQSTSYLPILSITRSPTKENSRDSSEEITLFYISLCLFFEYKHPKLLSCKIPIPFHQVPQRPGFFLGLLEAWYPHLLERSPARVWRWEPECFWFGAAQVVNLSLPPLRQPSLAMERNKRGYSGTLADREERCYAISRLWKQVSDIFLLAFLFWLLALARSLWMSEGKLSPKWETRRNRSKLSHKYTTWLKDRRFNV